MPPDMSPLTDLIFVVIALATAAETIYEWIKRRTQ